jgi:hypothetical protein
MVSVVPHTKTIPKENMALVPAKKTNEWRGDRIWTWCDAVTGRGSKCGVESVNLVLPIYNPTAGCLCIATPVSIWLFFKYIYLEGMWIPQTNLFLCSVYMGSAWQEFPIFLQTVVKATHWICKWIYLHLMEELDFIDFGLHSLMMVARDMFNRHEWWYGNRTRDAYMLHVFSVAWVKLFFFARNSRLYWNEDVTERIPTKIENTN